MRIAAMLLLLAGWAQAATLTGSSVQILDVAGVPRETFTDAESIALYQAVFNADASANRIRFTFRIQNPGGTVVFTQSGNAAQGSPGQATARISGIPARLFWTGPGTYTLVAEAELDGGTITQTKTFGIFSPNVTLLYPSDGARELQPPLAMRWASSGSSRYRVLVDDDPGFYNTLFSGETDGPVTFFDYPDNPENTLQRLSGGQIYYWKIEGLDQNGNKIAESGVASFMLRSQASSQTRDLSVTSLEFADGSVPAAGPIPFRVKITNRGGTTEPNVKVTFTLGGLEPPDSPKTIDILSPGQELELGFSALMQSEQTNSIAFATVLLQDDNPLNNYRQLAVSRPAPLSTSLLASTTETLDLGQTGPGTDANDDAEFASPTLRPKYAWKRVRKGGLDPALRDKFRGYRPVGLESGLDEEALKALLDALEDGKAHIVRAEAK